MQIAAEAESERWRHAARPAQAAALAEPAQRAMPDAEYKRMFISLIDPTAMVRTDECLEIAGRIGEHSAAAGWEQGVRTASLFKGLYEDMSEMLDRPVADGVRGKAIAAVRDTLDYLRRFGQSYRDGTPVEPKHYVFCTDERKLAARRDERDLDPILALEKVRSKVADLRGEASRMERAGPEDEAPDPGYPPELVEPKRPPWTCRQALMRSEWMTRKRLKKWGYDHIFPPKPESFAGLFADYAVPGVSSLDMVRAVRGRGRLRLRSLLHRQIPAAARPSGRCWNGWMKYTQTPA